MQPLRPVLAALALASCAGVLAACDGTLTGIGRVPRPPETPLPPAPEWNPDAGAARAREPSEIAASHLLVMYKGSRSAPKTIERTREQARLRAEEALARIRAGEDFAKVAAAYTDEAGGAERAGRLGRFSRDQMVRPFADAAFALAVGQTSGIVETAFGFHVIRRTE